MDWAAHCRTCMTIMFLVAVIHVPRVRGNTLPLHPDADNVCIVEEEYSVIEQVTEHYHEQYKESKWCLRVPPRCTVYKWRLATRKVPKLVNKTRSVVQCCEGYIPNGDGCKAVCAESCRHGFCNAPNQCSCFPGFRGRLCEDICKSGTFGRNCTQQCECLNEAFCNAMSGSCLCTPGWRGKRCADPCEENYFGYECRRPCYCDGNPCHHITGECFIPSTTSTEATVTTSVSSLEQPSSTSREDIHTSVQNISMPESIQIQFTSSVQTTPVSPNLSRNPSVAVLSTEYSSDSVFSSTSTTTGSSSSEDNESANLTTEGSLWNLKLVSSTESSWTASAASESSTSAAIEPLTTATSEPFTTIEVEQLSSTEPTTEYFTTSSLLDFSVSSSLRPTSETASSSESELSSSTTKDVEVSSTAWVGREETSTTTTQEIEDSDDKDITESIMEEGYTETTTKHSKNIIGIEKKSAGAGDSNMVGLSVAIAFSVLLSIILLFATASLAMARHRKLPIPPPSDFGLYNLYAEEPITAKAVFMNPTYSCADADIFVPKTDLQTFKATAATGTFEAELREILELQYDHPPLPVSRSSTPYGHLYDEINQDRFDRPVFSSFGQRT